VRWGLCSPVGVEQVGLCWMKGWEGSQLPGISNRGELNWELNIGIDSNG
jgi:hypothetical protein